MKTKTIWSRIRKQVEAPSNTKCIVLDGNFEPVLKGSKSYYKTKAGEIIRTPKAYRKVGWGNMLYYPSTLRVEVGKDWIAQNITNKELSLLVAERILNTRNVI